MLHMRLTRICLYIISAGFYLAGFAHNSNAEEVINPHWTGKHCQECHAAQEPKKNNAPLKFNGDPRQICDRCHTKTCITNQSHSSDIVYRGIPGYTVPAQWPLRNKKLSCLTCHDAIPPMYDNFPLKRTDSAFLRGAPYKNKNDFCLTCHTKKSLQTTNPHKQLDKKGNIIAQTCITCHKAVPDPRRTKDIRDVTFKESFDAICIGCHFAHPASHGPTSGQHKLSDYKLKSLEKQKSKFDVEIPLIENRMFCATCHNPHEKGVMQRAAAERGAGEKYFLRLPGGYELCVSCHYRKTLQDRTRQAKQPAISTLKTTSGVLVSHKPYLENKCKSCHEITPDQRGKPKPLFLCFRQGCHKTELIEKPFEHNKSVLENCYACHESHASGYGKLLRVNEEVQCYSCHPLIKNKNSKNILETIKEKSNRELHPAFAAYVRTSAVPAGDDCGFCHTMKHRNNIGTMPPGTCTDCHLYVQKLLRKNSPQPLNVHETFKEKLCSKCHDPHAAPYQYQLKKPRETYLK
jgi:predicted CXXCH cytochrome family protein